MISIIVPVYKVEKYLDRCVQSILKQTFSNIEVILIDDGSPDNCPKICDDWAEKDDRIRVIHKDNGGLSDARNYGMKIAQGEYIGFVDSDDWIAPEMYERLLASIMKEKSDIAACSVEMVWEDGRPSKMLTVQKNCVMGETEAQKELLLEKNILQPVWYKLYKKKLIEDIPFEIGKNHEDVYWSYQVFSRSSKVSLIDYIGYFYFQRTNSIMNISYNIKRLDVIEAFRLRVAFMLDRYPELASDVRVNYRNNIIYHGQMCDSFLRDKEKVDAFNYLKTSMKQVPLRKSDYKNVKISHRIWLSLSCISLKLACKIKNILKVGL